MNTTKIIVYGFPELVEPTTIGNIMLADSIHDQTNWAINYDEIKYLPGCVWDHKKKQFQPGRSAYIYVQDVVTAADIKIINAAKVQSSDMYTLTYELSNSIDDNASSTGKDSHNAYYTYGHQNCKMRLSERATCTSTTYIIPQHRQNCRAPQSIKTSIGPIDIVITPQATVDENNPIQVPQNRNHELKKNQNIHRTSSNSKAPEVGILNREAASHKSPPSENPLQDVIFDSLGTEILGEDENNNSYSKYNYTRHNSLPFASTTNHKLSTLQANDEILNGKDGIDAAFYVGSTLFPIPSIKPSLTSNGYVLNDKNKDRFNPRTFLTAIINSNEDIFYFLLS